MAELQGSVYEAARSQQEIERMRAPEISVVIPLHNEAGMPRLLVPRLESVLAAENVAFEVIFVDDGSRDSTFDELRELSCDRPHLKVISFSRNFGKEAALSAGIDVAKGQAIVLMDGDLQHPPETLPQLIAAWREGYEIVAAVRTDRSSDSYLKLICSRLFYFIINRISAVEAIDGEGDFRLLDRKVADALKRMPERARFMKGLYNWVGFRKTSIDYFHPPRVSGNTQFSFSSLLSLAGDGIFSFSLLPLRVWSVLGVISAMIALVYAAYIIARTLWLGVEVPGYASLLVAVLFVGGLNLIGLGVVGEYVGRTFLEAKGRPLYLVKEAIGFEESESQARAAERS